MEKRFSLLPLTHRDRVARTLECALSLDAPRLSPQDARVALPEPIGDSLMTRFMNLFRGPAVLPTTPMSTSQRVQLTLAHACNLQILDVGACPDSHRRYRSIRKQQDAADFI